MAPDRTLVIFAAGIPLGDTTVATVIVDSDVRWMSELLPEPCGRGQRR